jgi:hypothetical protein
MTGTNCDFFTHKESWSYLNHLVHYLVVFHLLPLTESYKLTQTFMGK